MTDATTTPLATVLIIDDIPANLGIVVDHLEMNGYRVVIAQEGEEGLQRAMFVQPDIILLDVVLPGEDGFSVCRRLKASEKTCDIPVIFMTSLSEEKDKLTGFEAGGVDYITKPLRIGEVIARVNVHIELQKMQKQVLAQNFLLQRNQEVLEEQVAQRTEELTASNALLKEEIAQRQTIQAALEESERQYRTLVENTPDTIARYDVQCRRIFANPKMIEELGGENNERILFSTPKECPGGKNAAEYQNRIAQVFIDGKNANFELSWKSSTGKELISYVRLTPEFDNQNNVVSVLAVGREISDIIEYRTSIHHLAFYDSLTDLPNRTLLMERMRQAIANASTHGHDFGLILLDLDRFKEINNTLGHGMGDQLLCMVADRLLQTIHVRHTVARFGGDEFAVLVQQVQNSDDLADVASKILCSFAKPFKVFGREMFISASLGIVSYPSDSADIDALLRYADSAMYHAKKLGRNNFQFYAKELTARTGNRVTLETALHHACNKGELELHYQPQVDLIDGHVIGAEALIRWNRGNSGIVSPDKFIPIAEESGLIISIGEWVLRVACHAAVKWNIHRETTPLVIAVNLSSRQFLQNDLLATVKQILQDTGCKSEWLKLEITESLLLNDNHEILDTLNSFDEMGLKLSIDDFGTGYSALSYLNRFPMSQIKIDRSFINDILDVEDKAELVKAMIYIAQALHLDLIAEGVETQEQAEYLKNLGCPSAQGYLFGKPMPDADFEMWLANAEK